MEVIKSAHSVYRLQYHVVWVTKYRRRILKPFVKEYLRKVLPKLLRSMPGVTIEMIGLDVDRLHMVMVILPKYAMADVMGRMKGQSPIITSSTQVIWLAWQSLLEREYCLVAGNFVSSVGIDENVIRRYVEY